MQESSIKSESPRDRETLRRVLSDCFVSVLGKGNHAAVIAKLEENRVQLQAEMSKHVILKYTPHLFFHLDDSIERGTRVIEIMQEIDSARENKA